MHFDILIEDKSGTIALESIVEKILGANGQPHTSILKPYKGIGRLPVGLYGKTDPKKRILLDRLPKILGGYGKGRRGFSAAVVVVVDLDQRDCMEFKQELLDVLNNCDPAPKTLFRIAIEEVEAWFLGDRNAVLTAYPNAKTKVLETYDQDAICGTWEVLADAIHPGGSAVLEREAWFIKGKEKCKWAREIAPHMDVDNNQSPSFRVFRDGLRRLAGMM